MSTPLALRVAYRCLPSSVVTEEDAAQRSGGRDWKRAGREGTTDKHTCTQRLAPCAFICYLTDTRYDARCGIPVLIYHLYQFVGSYHQV